MVEESKPLVHDLTGAPVGYTFAVGDDVVCFWDHDHLGRNREYLNGIDVSYYEVLMA